MFCRVKMEHFRSEVFLSFKLHTTLSGPVESSAVSWRSPGHPPSEAPGISEHKVVQWLSGKPWEGCRVWALVKDLAFLPGWV